MGLHRIDKPIHGHFSGSSFLSLSQCNHQDIKDIFHLAKQFAQQKQLGHASKALSGRVFTLLFFEPSSRTFGSFSSAVKRLGGATVEIQDASVTSAAKGETLEDTIRVFSRYSDGIIMRHHMPGAALRAATAASVPVVNAGDGIGEHPTQALLDLYTIHSHRGNLDNVRGMVVGDLYNGRTVHSLIQGLSIFKKPTIYMLSPDSLALSKELADAFSAAGVTLHVLHDVSEIPADLDFWYWTRVQKERFANLDDYEQVKHQFVLTPELAESYAGKNTLFMHPLPRVGEIDERVDSDPRAVYFEQVQNGLYVRMALLKLLFETQS